MALVVQTGTLLSEQGHAFEAHPAAAWAPLPGRYRRRDPEATVLHQVVRENLATFLDEAVTHQGLPRFVEQDFLRYLECGVLARGFSRVRCEACGDELLVAVSCKRRGVCCVHRPIVITGIGHRNQRAGKPEDYAGGQVVSPRKPAGLCA